MEEEDKVSGIENYLEELFPHCVLKNMRDSRSGRYIFRVHAPTGETKHTIVVSGEFIRDNEVEDMVICLKLYNLKGYLEMFGNKEILVTNDGINPEGIRPSLIE